MLGQILFMQPVLDLIAFVLILSIWLAFAWEDGIISYT